MAAAASCGEGPTKSSSRNTGEKLANFPKLLDNDVRKQFEKYISSSVRRFRMDGVLFKIHSSKTKYRKVVRGQTDIAALFYRGILDMRRKWIQFNNVSDLILKKSETD
jgi:hypothetical protein